MTIEIKRRKMKKKDKKLLEMTKANPTKITGVKPVIIYSNILIRGYFHKQIYVVTTPCSLNSLWSHDGATNFTESCLTFYQLVSF